MVVLKGTTSLKWLTALAFYRQNTKGCCRQLLFFLSSESASHGSFCLSHQHSLMSKLGIPGGGTPCAERGFVCVCARAYACACLGPYAARRGSEMRAPVSQIPAGSANVCDILTYIPANAATLLIFCLS